MLPSIRQGASDTLQAQVKLCRGRVSGAGKGTTLQGEGKLCKAAPYAKIVKGALNKWTWSQTRWAEAPIKIARMTLTIKLDGNWSTFQLANSAPPLSVTGSDIAPSARMSRITINRCDAPKYLYALACCFVLGMRDFEVHAYPV